MDTAEESNYLDEIAEEAKNEALTKILNLIGFDQAVVDLIKLLE